MDVDVPQYIANFKILIIGESSVGKSSLLQRFTSDEFETKKSATIGVDFKVKILPLLDGRKVKLSIWDTAGQERFRTLTPNYYRGTHGALLIYDVSDMKTFNKIDSWIKELNAYSDLSDCVKVLVGNKLDLEPRQVSRDLGLSKAQSHGMLYAECSAKTSTGVKAVFYELVEKIYSQPKLWQERSPTSESFRLHGTRQRQQGCCSK